MDAEAVRERREDLQGLAGLFLLLLLRQRTDRAHVVETVGQLDQDYPDVGGHRHHHLAVVLCLSLVAALEGDAGQLGDAVDQLSDLVAEGLANLFQAGAGVLDRVVEERRAQCGGVQAESGADPPDSERMGDEILARLALLAGVPLAGEGEGALDLLAVDRLRGVRLVLLDDCEEVAEEGALVGAELARDRVDAGRARLRRRLANARVAPAPLVAQLDAVGKRSVLRGARYVGCALLRRNRIASWYLATQSA